MFTSFDENKFRQAIKDKDFIRLKSDTVSTMLNDPTFKKGETMQAIEILKKEVPEIFQEEIDLGYEERLEPAQWNKRYFTKLTYWFEENFAISRIDYIKEVGTAVTLGTVASTPKKEVKAAAEVQPVVAEPVKEKKPAIVEGEQVTAPVEKEKAPVVEVTNAEKKPAQKPVAEKSAQKPVVEKQAQASAKKEAAPAKPVVKTTTAPKKKSKLPKIVAGVAVAAIVVIAIVFIKGLL